MIQFIIRWQRCREIAISNCLYILTLRPVNVNLPLIRAGIFPDPRRNLPLIRAEICVRICVRLRP